MILTLNSQYGILRVYVARQGEEIHHDSNVWVI
jgi:hypothetical protein